MDAAMNVDGPLGDNSRLTAGPYAGETFRYVRITNPGYVFQLMSKPVFEVIPFLPFIVYCTEQMRGAG